MSDASQQFALGYQISPIVLIGGLASAVAGGMLPIISITESQNFRTGLLSGGGPQRLEDYFAQFKPMQGASLIEQDVAEYPFANQQVAANAVIAKPLTISLRMNCPARPSVGWASKQAILKALRAALAQHNALGGTYNVATPAYIWTNCLLVSLRDISAGDSNQPQVTWQWDFRQPLLTLDQAQQVQSALMYKLSNQTPINGEATWSGLEPTIGSPPSLATAATVPAAQASTGAGVAGPQVATGLQ